jgi:MFS family permease
MEIYNSKSFYGIKIQLLSFMSIAHFIHHVQLYAFPALLILISQDISLNYLQMGVLGSVPVLIMAITSPFIGYLGKNIRTGFSTILLGIFLFSLSSIMISISNNFIDLFLGNIILGLGCTTYHPIGLGVAANSFSGENRGKAMAVNHAAGVIGTAVAPLGTIGLSVFIFGWKYTFFLLGIGCFILLLFMTGWAVIQKLSQSYIILVADFNQKINKEIDEIDSSKIHQKHKRWILITLGILIMVSAFRGGVYRLISYFTVTLLRDFYSVESFEAGFLTSVILLLGSLSDVYGAYISDKSGAYGRVKMIIVSASGTSLAIIILMYLTVNFSVIWAILLGFSFFAISFYLAGGTLQALMSDLVPQESRTFFYSIVFSLGLVVSSISPTIFGALLDIFGSAIAGFGFILILIILSLFITLIFKKRLAFAANNNLLSP